MLSGLAGDFDDWPNLRTVGLVPSSGQDPGQIYLMGSRNVQVPNSTQVMLRSVDWI